MKTEHIKYLNILWLEPLKRVDPNLYEGILKIHRAICAADNIADGVDAPSNVCFSLLDLAEGLSCLKPEYFCRVQNVLKIIANSEIHNITFDPEKEETAEGLDLILVKTRASLLDLYFEAFCCVEPNLDTEENRKWFSKFKEHSLIFGDCRDIINGVFEDLRMKRRNYVVLKAFGRSGYFRWENKKSELQEQALKIRNELSLEVPKDQRLMIFLSGCEDGNWVLKYNSL